MSGEFGKGSLEGVWACNGGDLVTSGELGKGREESAPRELGKGSREET